MTKQNVFSYGGITLFEFYILLVLPIFILKNIKSLLLKERYFILIQIIKNLDIYYEFC